MSNAVHYKRIAFLVLCLLITSSDQVSAQVNRRIASARLGARTTAAQRLPNNLSQQSQMMTTQRTGGTSTQGGGLYGRNATAVSTRPLSEPINGNYPRNGFRNNLPPTRFDSFVLNAGAHAEHIYGDEGEFGPPPYECFTEVHRINTGINGDRDLGLTTGHGSYLPDAFGRDEFLGAPEWSQSGTRGYETNGRAIKTDGVKANDQQFYNGYEKLDEKHYLDEDRRRPE